MKKILFAAFAATLISGITFAADGGKKKSKKQSTECSKSCSGSACCIMKSKAA